MRRIVNAAAAALAACALWATPALAQLASHPSGEYEPPYDAGIGIGVVSPGFGPLGQTGFGLGYSGGLGVEIPLARSLSLVPEVYYRAVSASSEGGISGTVSAVGLQVGLVYY